MDILRALGLVPRTGAISLGALLLFGRPEAITRWIPSAEVLVQDSRQATQVTEQFIAVATLSAPGAGVVARRGGAIGARGPQESDLQLGVLTAPVA